MIPRIDIMSYTSIVTSTKSCKSCKAISRSSVSLSTSSRRFLCPTDHLSFVWYNVWIPFSVASTLESTLQSEVLTKNYRFWAKVFPSLLFLWLVVVVVNVGKFTDQDFPELHCSVQLRRTLHGNIWWLVDRFNFTTVTSN